MRCEKRRLLPFSARGFFAFSPPDAGVWIAKIVGKNVIFKVDPASGSIVEKLDSPTPFVVGLTTDGENVLIADADSYEIVKFKK